MDRKIGMIAVCGLLIASLTGCSSWFSPDAAKLGQDMNVALDSISSLSGTLDVSGSSEDDSFFLQASFEALPGAILHLDGSYDSGIGTVRTMEQYIDQSYDVPHVYEQFASEGWVQQTISDSEGNVPAEFFGLVLDGTGFSDENAEAVKGEPVFDVPTYQLDRIVTGTELQECLDLLLPDVFGEMDASKSNLALTVWLDQKTKLPLQERLVFADSGQPLVFSDGSSVSDFEIQIQFSSYNTVSELTVPNEVLSEVSSRQNSSASVRQSVEGQESALDPERTLISKDDRYAVSVQDFDSMTNARLSEDTLVLSSKEEGSSQPVLELSFGSNPLDTYSCALADRDAAYSYYGNPDNGLSDGYVSDLTVYAISEHYPVYGYCRQYTNLEQEFVSQEYVFYIELDGIQYVSGRLYALYDTGESVTLDETFFQELLDHIVILSDDAA